MLVAMSLLSSGCLVPEPATLPGAGADAAYFRLKRSVSEPGRIRRRQDEPGRHQLHVSIRSEDLDEKLTALVYLDFKLPSEDFVFSFSGSPSTLADLDRTIRFSWNPDSLPERCRRATDDDAGCCRQLTLMVMHESSVDATAIPQLPDPVRSLADLAVVYWWLGIDAPEGDPANLGSCPRGTDPQQ